MAAVSSSSSDMLPSICFEYEINMWPALTYYTFNWEKEEEEVEEEEEEEEGEEEVKSDCYF